MARKKRFICNACGETWDKHPATVVACPQCFAPEGSPCVRPSEHGIPGGDVHLARERLAVDTGKMVRCSQGPTALGLNKTMPADISPRQLSFLD